MQPQQIEAVKRARTKPGRPSYTDAEVERGLLAVADASGNTRIAAAFLAEDGLTIDDSTLWRWSRKSHAKRYERIRAEVLPKVRAQAADQHMDLAKMQMDVTRRLTERLAREVDEVPARDLPGGIRNLSTAAAVETDKAQLLGGEPTIRIERSADQVLRALAARGMFFPQAFDGHAEEENASQPAALQAETGDRS
jgi:hypothetical protein